MPELSARLAAWCARSPRRRPAARMTVARGGPRGGARRQVTAAATVEALERVKASVLSHDAAAAEAAEAYAATVRPRASRCIF